jgi:2-polyprenyl-3-methyl-5-hydroxy-6-metoxy-1,4-benzoquinol methylase
MGIVATSESTGLLDAIRELAEYREQDPLATAFNVGNSFYLVNEQWRRAVDGGNGGSHGRAPETPAEIMHHYRTCEMQVEQQVFAAYGIPSEIELRKQIVGRVRPGSAVLDFGAGIGSHLVPLLAQGCRCTHVDVGGVMMRYAAWRYRRRGYRAQNGRPDPAWVELIELPDHYMDEGVPGLAARTFDVVTCTEVVEHVPEPVPLVALLATLVRPGGLLVAQTSFHDHDGMVPMHLAENLRRYTDESFAAEVVPRFGLRRLEGPFYRKPPFYREP